MGETNVEKELQQFAFTAGVDQKTGEVHVQAPKLIAAENVRINKDGTLDKRPGFDVVSSSQEEVKNQANQPGIIDTSLGGKLLRYRDETVLLTAKKAGAYMPETETFSYRDETPEYAVRREPLAHAPKGVCHFDMAVGNGLRVYVYVSSNTEQGSDSGGPVLVEVTSVETGTVMVSGYQLTTFGNFARVTYSSSTNSFFVVWHDDGEDNLSWLEGVIIDATLLTISAPQPIDIDGKEPDQFELAPYSTGFFLAFPTDDDLWIASFNASFGQLNMGLVASTDSNAKSAVSIDITSDFIWLAWVDEVDPTQFRVYIAALHPTLWNTVAIKYSEPTDITPYTTTVVQYDSTSAIAVISGSHTETPDDSHIVSETPDPIKMPVLCAMKVTSAGTTEIELDWRKTWWANVASKAWRVDDRVYIWASVGYTSFTIGHNGVVEPVSMALLDVNVHLPVEETGNEEDPVVNYPARPCATTIPRTAIMPEYPEYTLQNPCSVYEHPTTGEMETICWYIKNGQFLTGLQLVSADMEARHRWQAGTLVDTLHVSGGLNAYWDHHALEEIGFLYYPWDPVVLDGATDDGALEHGKTYYYRAVYKYVDYRGNTHRSAPSQPVPVTISVDGDAAVLYIPALCVTTRENPTKGWDRTVVVEVYRTIADPVGTSTDLTYYLTQELWETVPNDPRDPYVIYVDGKSDEDLRDGPTLYTSGGIVDNVCPPASISLCEHKGRLWIASDDRRTLWFSKQTVEGEAVAFADEFTLLVDDPSPIVAVRSMDQHLVIFTQDRVHMLDGEGPLDTALGSDYVAVQRVSADVGCSDANTIVSTPDGLMFRSTKGRMCLLDRGLSVSDFGWPIEDSLSSASICYSAALHPERKEVLWDLGDPSVPDHGLRLVFDYRLREWFVDRISDGETGAACVLSAMPTHDDEFVWLDRTGQYCQESRTSWLDNGEWVSMFVSVAWAKYAGVLGYQKMQTLGLLADRHSAHQLTVTVRHDYDPAQSYTKIWENAVMSLWPTQQFQMELDPQFSQAVRFEFRDSAPESGGLGTGQGATLISYGVGGWAERGFYRLPEGQRA